MNGIRYKIAIIEYPDSIKQRLVITDDFKLNLDYWNMLYPKAVGYSAGVIDYFQRQFAKIDEEKKSAGKSLSWWQKTKNYLAYNWGDAVSASGIIRQNAEKTGSALVDNTVQTSKIVAEATGETLVQAKDKVVVSVVKTADATSKAAKSASKAVSDTIKTIAPKASPQVLGVKLVQAEEIEPSINTQEPGLIDPDLKTSAPDSSSPPLVLWTPPVEAPVIIPSDPLMPYEPSTPTTTVLEEQGSSTTTEDQIATSTPPDLEPATSTEEIVPTSTPPIEEATTTEIIVPIEPVDPNIADHIVISEISARGPAGASDEFVELYNPTDQDVSLKGWRIESKTNVINWWIGRTGADGLPDKIIKAKGYFLIAANGYSLSAVPDYYHYANWGLPDNNGVYRLVDGSGMEIDKIGYGASSDYEGASFPANFANGGSISRYAKSSSTPDTMADSDRWEGNGIDTGNNSSDFYFLPSAEPQNSYSPIEPGPSDSDVAGKISDLAKVSSTDTTVVLSWTSSINANVGEGAVYDIRYMLKNGNCTLINNWETASSAPAVMVPQAQSGIVESFEVTGLSVNSAYCFGVRIYNGKYWSDISNVLGTITVASPLLPAFTGEFVFRYGIASKTTASTTPDENIIIFDFTNSPDRGYRPFGHQADSVTASNDIGWGNGSGSRLIIEAEYDPSSKLYTGRYRHCKDYYSSPVRIQNDQCTDSGTWWTGKRWLTSNVLINASEISIFNSNQYTPWIKP